MADDDSRSDTSGTANGNGNGGAGDGDAAPVPRSSPPEPQSEVLSLSQLIGAPIHALVDAEAQSAMATARFIRNVGFTPPRDGEAGDFGDLQMARFTTRRQLENGEEEAVEVQIPMLTLLPIPALQIRDASLEYVVKVIQTEALPAAHRQVVETLGERDSMPRIEPPATMRATFASDSRSSGRRSMDMLVKMQVRIEQADMPAGLSRLLNLAGEAVSRAPVVASGDRSPDEEGTPPVEDGDDGGPPERRVAPDPGGNG